MPKLGRPKRLEWDLCKVKECESTTEGGAKGFCPTHYHQFHRGLRGEDGALLRQPQRVSSYGEGARCLAPGCGRRPKVRGLCAKHIQQFQAGKLRMKLPTDGHKRSATAYRAAKCLVEGCPQRAVNHWMCSKHSQQRRAGILDAAGNQLREMLALGRRHKEGPIVDGAGYLLVVAPEGYQGKTRDGDRVLQHRLVLEQYLGRLLLPYEIVHHKNGDRADNRLENLELLDGRARHGQGHPPGSSYTKEQLQVALDHLQINDPEAYSALLKRRQ